MLALRRKQNRDQKSNDRAAADPPGKLHSGKPPRNRVGNFAKESPDCVRKVTDDGDDDETCDHSNDVAAIVAARSCEHAREKNSENRAIGVAINSEDDRNNANVWQDDYEIG